MLRELRGVYRALDARLVGHSCERSTECCRFGVTGREPYVTAIELEALDDALRARGRSLAALAQASSTEPRGASSGGRAGRGRARSLPMVDVDERRCPLLDERGACLAYEGRPLGCRTFYCSRATADRRLTHAELGALVREVEALSDRLVRAQAGGAPAASEKGRPLVRALATRARR